MTLAILENATIDSTHEWTLPTRLVAEGYGVSPEVIRSHKANHSDELFKDRHFFAVGKNCLWTRAGVIRLGMFIQSPEAIEFRNAAEKHLLTSSAAKPSYMSTVENFNALPASSEQLDLLADAIADEVLANELRNRINASLEKKRSDRSALEGVVGKLGFPIPQSWKNAA